MYVCICVCMYVYVYFYTIRSSYLSSNVPHSSTVGGGNAPITWMPAANSNPKEEEEHSRQLVLDVQLAICSWNTFCSYTIEALVSYLGTGPRESIRHYRKPHSQLLLCLRTLDTGVLSHPCILGSFSLVILISLIWTAPNGPFPLVVLPPLFVSLFTPSSSWINGFKLTKNIWFYVATPSPCGGRNSRYKHKTVIHVYIEFLQYLYPLMIKGILYC